MSEVVARLAPTARDWLISNPAASSARSFTLLFALSVASLARRRSISVRWVGGATYETAVNGDQGTSRAHRTL